MEQSSVGGGSGKDTASSSTLSVVLESCRQADSGGLGTGYWSGGGGSVNEMTGTLTLPILSGNCTSVLQLRAVPFVAVEGPEASGKDFKTSYGWHSFSDG